MHEDLVTTVRELAGMSLPDRRWTFDQLVRRAFTLTGGEFAHSLDFNARLVTLLREEKVELFTDGVRP